MSISRRGFISSAIAASVAGGLNQSAVNAEENANPRSAVPVGVGKRPIIICANNGVNYLDDAFAFLRNGGDTLDAALRVVKGPEDDPNDDSVGLGGLPNEEGVVELDACCMHGPTRRAGSVGGVRNIKNDIQINNDADPVDVTLLVQDALDRYALIPDDSDVVVDTNGNTVTLNGHVETWAEHDAVVEAAWMATGVYDVRDELDITG